MEKSKGNDKYINVRRNKQKLEKRQNQQETATELNK